MIDIREAIAYALVAICVLFSLALVVVVPERKARCEAKGGVLIVRHGFPATTCVKVEAVIE